MEVSFRGEETDLYELGWRGEKEENADTKAFPEETRGHGLGPGCFLSGSRDREHSASCYGASVVWSIKQRWTYTKHFVCELI